MNEILEIKRELKEVKRMLREIYVPAKTNTVWLSAKEVLQITGMTREQLRSFRKRNPESYKTDGGFKYDQSFFLNIKKAAAIDQRTAK